MIRVKICANKRKEDALKAIEYGTDALGFLVGQVHASDDFISAVQAKEIVDALPPFCSTVLVTHIADGKEIVQLAKETNVDTVQLHGVSTRSDVAVIRDKLPYLKLYKAVHIIDKSSVEEAKGWEGFVDAILLDTANVAIDQVGGTGRTHDWSISARIVQETKLPVILAGGLTPENVAEAIRQVKPYGVDVNSGTKEHSGFKDPQKLRAFIENAKAL
jgi:phosphoribosylanthranilate isomerase